MTLPEQAARETINAILADAGWTVQSRVQLNLVMEYSRQRAEADGINVDGQVYRIRTAITCSGAFWASVRLALKGQYCSVNLRGHHPHV